MLTTKEAIAARRSVRKFTHQAVPEEVLLDLIDAARLAPSACNSQPWRFKIVSDPETRAKLRAAANGQRFIEAAPSTIVCCVDLAGYVEESCASIKELVDANAMKGEMAAAMLKRNETLALQPRAELAGGAAFNMGIAGEHIALRALDHGLGTCWVRAFDESAVRSIFGWDENLFVVALLPVGYPAESPAPRRRMPLSSILLP